MKEKNYTGIIPEQQTGKAIDAESFVELNNEEEAKTVFVEAKNKLQNVNEWHTFAGHLSAKFQLVDQAGVEIKRAAQKRDYFKIDIPGPGSKSGEGYDWVQIEEVESTTTPEMESFGLRVRPAPNPQNQNQDIAHFYAPESTSTFTVTREGKKVTAAIYDRNTEANKEADSIKDKIRDVVIGVAGKLGFSKIQWKSLTDGLIKKDK